MQASRGHSLSARAERHLKINHLSAACSLSFRRTMDGSLGVNSTYLVKLQECSKIGARWDFHLARISLAIQRLRLGASTAGDEGSILRELRSCMPRSVAKN